MAITEDIVAQLLAARSEETNKVREYLDSLGRLAAPPIQKWSRGILAIVHKPGAEGVGGSYCVLAPSTCSREVFVAPLKLSSKKEIGVHNIGEDLVVWEISETKIKRAMGNNTAQETEPVKKISPAAIGTASSRAGGGGRGNP